LKLYESLTPLDFSKYSKNKADYLLYELKMVSNFPIKYHQNHFCIVFIQFQYDVAPFLLNFYLILSQSFILRYQKFKFLIKTNHFELIYCVQFQ